MEKINLQFCLPCYICIFQYINKNKSDSTCHNKTNMRRDAESHILCNFWMSTKNSGCPIIIEISGKIAPMPIASNIAPRTIAKTINAHCRSCFDVNIVKILNKRSHFPFDSHLSDIFSTHVIVALDSRLPCCSSEKHTHSLNDNNKIREQIASLHIHEIVNKLVIGRSIVLAIESCHTRDARLHIVSIDSIPYLLLNCLTKNGRSGLGPTILIVPCSTLMNCGSSPSGATNKPTDLGNAHIILPCHDWATLCLRILTHTAKLVNLEFLHNDPYEPDDKG